MLILKKLWDHLCNVIFGENVFLFCTIRTMYEGVIVRIVRIVHVRSVGSYGSIYAMMSFYYPICRTHFIEYMTDPPLMTDIGADDMGPNPIFNILKTQEASFLGDIFSAKMILHIHFENYSPVKNKV